MKTVVIIILVLFSTSAMAQFEGTIRWSMKTEITDPAMKAQMEANQAKMNDPANQAKMKEAQAEMKKRMEDPQMKKMMEQNPQMKAQMEQMMAMQGSGGPGQMLPTSMVLKLKGENTLTITEGGMMNSEILYLKSTDVSYMINRAGKTYTTIQTQGTQPAAAKPPEVKVTKTAETKKILNYTCTKYVAEITSSDGKKMNQIFWTTTEIKGLDSKLFTKQRLDRGKQMFYENMEGIPLRVEMDIPEMKGKMTMEVLEIKKEQLKAEDFAIPEGFKEVPPTPGMPR